MTETKNILIIALTILLAVVIYCFGTRYSMIAGAETELSAVYLYDRITGNMWVSRPNWGYWLRVKSLDEIKKWKEEQKR
jgi:hypothetical protein